MAAGADPIGSDIAAHRGRQTLHRHQAAPGGQPGKARPVIAADPPPDFGVDAVGTDDHVAMVALAAGEDQPGAVIGLFETDAAGAEVQAARRARVEGIEQNPVQVATVQRPVRRAVKLPRGRRDRTASRSARC